MPETQTKGNLDSTFKKLIEEYKIIREKGDWNEIYKWELVNSFQQKWDIDAKDFTQMFKKIKFANLLFANTLAANKTLAERQPEGFRKCFKILYDESKPLKERAENYFSEVRSVFKKADTNPKHYPFQDERSIATYLCFRYPEKYSFYKSQFYVKLCKTAGISPAKPGAKYLHYLSLLQQLCTLIKQDKELIALHEESMTPSCYREKEYKILAQDILYRTLSKGYEPDDNDEEVSEEKNDEQKEIPGMKTHSLNTILYGPPGTGKTYKTKEVAVEIIDGEVPNDREKLNKRYNELYNSSQIAFVTFHQSMSYEDFVEGIKPMMEDETSEIVRYQIKDGIFKKLCKKAGEVPIAKDNFDEAYQSLLKEIKKNSGKLTLETLVLSREFSIYENTKGNLKFHPNTEKATEAVIKKEYIKHFLETGESLDWPTYLKPVAKYLQEHHGYKKETRQTGSGKYVLIIDEINRGNIASILGELITLTEDDKRAGNKEAITVTLPYSKEKFSLPPNLYIIGTMNTADRSVEALDTALRRRFTFKEMMPEPELLIVQQFEDNSIQLDRLLITINDRIELLLDKDHLIGHSFFMKVFSWFDLWNVFEQKIIPQLKEYFYGDYGKIAAILGTGFVNMDNKKRAKLFSFNGTDYSDSEKAVFKFESFTKINGSFDKDKFINAIHLLIEQTSEQFAEEE